ncbi:MAG: PA2778 family cysteine peptidase [Gammaproteobacteria bacterium]|nr:MAG: PA2778 family cysteine peptidase [Gammaproteobacteria bacterium]
MNRALSTRRMVGVLLLTALLQACAAPPQTRALLDSQAAGLPVRTELTETPFYPQDRYQCGPAALATVLGGHSIEVTPEALADAVYIPGLHGSLPEEITASARRYAMLAYPLEPSLADLVREIAAGHPVLIMQNLGTRWFPRWHFAVVIGYDLAAGEVILRSGTTKRWQTTMATLERTWSRSGYWALVILPAGRLPATAQPNRYLRAARDLEESKQPRAARSAYQAAVHRWPANPRAWLALGNNLYAANEYQAAETAFRKVTTLAPEDAYGWNNLAYTLLQTDCPGQARQAAACALQRAPDDPNNRDTVQEINTHTRGGDAPHCLPVTCAPLTLKNNQ